jgi:dihydroflavonol-4-reductase
MSGDGLGELGRMGGQAAERVLVTGGTGFLGGLLLSRLVRDGRRVRALVRRPGDRERLPTPEVELALGDLADEEALARAADGCEVVYHAAGMNQLCLPDPTPLYQVNIEGTRHLLEAARRAGVRRVVYTSSAATLGGDASHPLDETAAAPEQLTSHYARSKLQAERVALGFTAVEVVALNPSSVQGPGRVTGTARVFIDYLNGKLPFDLPSRFGICYTEDCVSGHLLAELKGRPGHRYVLNTATVSNREAIDLIAVISGLTNRPRTLPLPLAMAAAACLESVARVRGARPILCREAVRTLGHPHLYDGSRAERELGLRYTPLRTAMEATVRWYVEHGLVTRRLPKLEGAPGTGGGSGPEPPRQEGGTAA